MVNIFLRSPQRKGIANLSSSISEVRFLPYTILEFHAHKQKTFDKVNGLCNNFSK